MRTENKPQHLINAATTSQKIRVIIALAVPAVVENFFQSALGFVDTYFVSKISLLAVSAVGVTNAILAIYFALFMAVGVAANVRIANFLGADQPEKARHIAQQSIGIAVFLGVLTGILTIFLAEPFLRMMGIEEDVLKLGALYFRIVGIPSIFMSLMFVVSAILRGAGDTKSPMYVSIVINILNAVLDYTLIFGFLFIPEMGIVGAAVATLISRMVGSGYLLYLMNRSQLLAFRKTYWKPDRVHLMELAGLGAPAAGERLLMRAGQIVYFGFVVAIGTNAFAAHQIAGNVEVLSYMIGYGFATAATILVGQQIGAGRYEEARKYAKLTTYLAFIFMTVVGALLFLFGEWAGSLFTSDPLVIQEIGAALKVSAVYQPFLAVLLILTGAYQGANNTKFPMYLTAIGMWAIRTVLVYVLALQLNMGLTGVWIAIGIDIAIRAVVLVVQFQRGKWMNLKKAPEPQALCHPQTNKENRSACVNNY